MPQITDPAAKIISAASIKGLRPSALENAAKTGAKVAEHSTNDVPNQYALTLDEWRSLDIDCEPED
jgi:hypothetical protein